MSVKGIKALVALGSFVAMTAIAAGTEQAADSPENTSESVPEFTDAFLGDAANYEAGAQVWGGQCRLCHGRDAYPGKAPRLNPRRYTADFVFDRVTNGFRKMPAWREIFTLEERMSVVAYILSDEFSP